MTLSLLSCQVRGDAILLQFKAPPHAVGAPGDGNKLTDFGMELWDMHYGKPQALISNL